jgi:hypothetical protein
MWHRVVDGDQCCVLRAYEELVVVAVMSVGGRKGGYLAVGGIEDHVLARCLPPAQDISALVGLCLEIHGASVRAAQGIEPHNLPPIVDDHRATLPSGGAFLRGEEDVAGGDALAGLCGHFHGGWVEVRARAEGPHPLFRREWRAWQGFDPWGAGGSYFRGALGRFGAHRA